MIGQFSRYNANLKKICFSIAKKIVWYFHKIIRIGLIYSQKLNNLIFRYLLSISLIGFRDNSFAKDTKNRKSVINYSFFLNRVVIS